MSYPVPEGLFNVASLTPAEEKEYLTLGEKNAQSLLSAMAETDPRCTWTFVKGTSNGVRIHKGKIAGTAIDTIRGECSINVSTPYGVASVEDLVELLSSQPTTPQLRASYKFLDPMNQDILILRNIAVPGHANYLLSVQWAAFGAPGPVWSRDFAYLQYVCKGKDPKSGRECAVVAAGSIERPDIPELSHHPRNPYNHVRGVLMGSGFVFRPTSDPAVWSCFYIVQLDPKGLIPPWLANIVAVDQASNAGRMRDYLQEVFQTFRVLGRTKQEMKAMDTLYVPAREGRDFIVTVPSEGAILDYTWWCSNGTIDFSLVPLEPHSRIHDVNDIGVINSVASAISKPTRIEGGKKMNFRVSASGGRWALRFDNSFSWMTPKHIYFLRIPSAVNVPVSMARDSSLLSAAPSFSAPPSTSSISKKSVILLSIICAALALAIDASGLVSTQGAVLAALMIGILAPFVMQGGSGLVKPSLPAKTKVQSAAPPGIFCADNSGTGVNPNDLFGLQKRQWMADDASTTCKCCGMEFGLFLRKHHCRLCGQLICDDCSRGRAVLPTWMQLSVETPRGIKPSQMDSPTVKEVYDNEEADGGCFRRGVRVCDRCVTLMKDKST